MPIYEYKCRQCDHQFETLVRHDDTPACPSCQSEDLERQFSMTAAVSTERSRSRSFQEARQKAKENKQEKDAAQREYERNYIKSHYEED